MQSFKDMLTKLFTDHPSVAEDFMHESDYYLENTSAFKETRDSMTYDCVEQYGGEGMGDNYYSVYKFTSVDTGEQLYIKFQGWYASYVGSEYRDFSFVQPKEVTRIEYL
jgi:hypothetical protein